LPLNYMEPPGKLGLLERQATLLKFVAVEVLWVTLSRKKRVSHDLFIPYRHSIYNLLAL